MESIDSARAAAGDVITARLVSAINDKQKHTLIPRNSIVIGRIVQVERLYGLYGQGIQSLRIGIKLEAAETGGTRRVFLANLMSVEKRRIKPAGAPAEGDYIGSGLDRLVRREELGSFDQMTNPDDDAVGYLLFDDVSSDYVIGKGTEMTGTTTAHPLH